MKYVAIEIVHGGHPSKVIGPFTDRVQALEWVRKDYDRIFAHVIMEMEHPLEVAVAKEVTVVLPP